MVANAGSRTTTTVAELVPLGFDSAALGKPR
jgi:hypothetical protein